MAPKLVLNPTTGKYELVQTDTKGILEDILDSLNALNATMSSVLTGGVTLTDTESAAFLAALQQIQALVIAWHNAI